MQGYELEFKDYAGKVGKSTIHTGPINALTLTEVEGQAAAYLAAVEAVIRGHIRQETLAAFRNTVADSKPSNQLARNVLRWEIKSIDTTQYMDSPLDAILNPYYGVVLTDTIRTANPALTIAGSNQVDLTVDPWPAFKTAFEALAVSPSGFAKRIQSITLIDK